LLLASSGIIGLWGIGFFSVDLQQTIFRARYEQSGLPEKEVDGLVGFWAGMTSLMMNVGAFFGIYGFSYVTHFLGRKRTFALAFVLALASTAFTFWYFRSIADVFWMIPIMGFCQLSLFGGYAIYFPELFPTRLRSTGTSFCYNGARYVAALGPTTLGLLTNRVFSGYPEPMRYAGVTMCSIFLLGLLVLPFAPETKGQPLPE
jgi:MFS family permease